MPSIQNVSIPSIGGRLPVAAKLFAGFGAVLLLIAAMGWVSVSRMGDLD